MATKAKEVLEENTQDMSIDELSAAIDAHMDDIGKKKPKEIVEKPISATPAKTTVKVSSEVPVSEKEEAKIEVKVAPKKRETSKSKKKTEEDQAKIVVKRGYVDKNSKSKEVSVPEKEEKEPLSQTSKVDLKPIDVTLEAESDSKPTQNKEVELKKNVVDVVLKKTQATKPVEVAVESDKEKIVEVAESNAAVEKKDEAVEAKEESVPKLAPIPKRGNDVAELDVQIPKEQAAEEAPNDVQVASLKTFDTKQYHIPIKPSHHHKKGGSVKVFIAVFAAILAVVYVLSELEIIDLASLVSTF